MTLSDILCYIVSNQPFCKQEQKEEVQGIIRSHNNNGHDRGGDAGPEGEPLFQVALYFHFQHHFPFLHFLFSALIPGRTQRSTIIQCVLLHDPFTYIFPFNTTSLFTFPFNTTKISLFFQGEDRGVAGVCFTNPLAPTASPAQVSRWLGAR